jgi:class I fructose-bisphosphate aldolase
MDTRDDILRMAHDSVQAGGAGLSIGRNVFQDPDPAGLIAALRGIVHHGQGVERALSVSAA